MEEQVVLHAPSVEKMTDFIIVMSVSVHIFIVKLASSNSIYLTHCIELRCDYHTHVMHLSDVSLSNGMALFSSKPHYTHLGWLFNSGTKARHVPLLVENWIHLLWSTQMASILSGSSFVPVMVNAHYQGFNFSSVHGCLHLPRTLIPPSRLRFSTLTTCYPFRGKYYKKTTICPSPTTQIIQGLTLQR
jgi:hypothetical protein